jgi:hypothetical protein
MIRLASVKLAGRRFHSFYAASIQVKAGREATAMSITTQPLEIRRIRTDPHQDRGEQPDDAGIAGKGGGAAGHAQPQRVTAHLVGDRDFRGKYRRNPDDNPSSEVGMREKPLFNTKLSYTGFLQETDGPVRILQNPDSHIFGVREMKSGP